MSAWKYNQQRWRTERDGPFRPLPCVLQAFGEGSETCAAWEQRRFEESDVENCFLVVSATNDVEVNEAVYRQAEARGVLCNAVDDPDRCDFFYPAVVRRGPLQIAISTAGYSPALAQRLRRELEDQFGPEYSGWVEQLGEVNTEGVEPLTAVIDLKLRLRDDVVTEGDIRDALLANAPEAQHGFFAVPKVIE